MSGARVARPGHECEDERVETFAVGGRPGDGLLGFMHPVRIRVNAGGVS
jgi:hypothetical protein